MAKLQLLALAGAGRLLLHRSAVCAEQGATEALLMPLVVAMQDASLQHAHVQHSLQVFFTAGARPPACRFWAFPARHLGVGRLTTDLTLCGVTRAQEMSKHRSEDLANAVVHCISCAFQDDCLLASLPMPRWSEHMHGCATACDIVSA